MQYSIFVEGKADKKFIEDLLLRFYPSVKSVVIDVGGKDNLNKISPLINESRLKGNQIVFIFDSDDSADNSKAILKTKANEIGLEIDSIFLFPNDKDKGNFESLILKLANTKFDHFFQCFDSYKSCLNEYSGLKIPSNKEKVYAYLLALGLEAAFDKRDYLNSEAWHLNAESEALKPLFDFLNDLFQTSNN